MWWLLLTKILFLQVSFLSETSLADNARLAFDQFLLLGIIPGTNIQITFLWIITAVWIVFGIWLVRKVFPNFQLGILKHEKKNTDIDLLSL